MGGVVRLQVTLFFVLFMVEGWWVKVEEANVLLYSFSLEVIPNVSKRQTNRNTDRWTTIILKFVCE